VFPENSIYGHERIPTFVSGNLLPLLDCPVEKMFVAVDALASDLASRLNNIFSPFVTEAK
jgi:hypothetical protein